MLCTLVVSIASRSVSGGRIEGIRFAIIDFPEPGGPSNRILDPIPLRARKTVGLWEERADGRLLLCPLYLRRSVRRRLVAPADRRRPALRSRERLYSGRIA